MQRVRAPRPSSVSARICSWPEPARPSLGPSRHERMSVPGAGCCAWRRSAHRAWRLPERSSAEPSVRPMRLQVRCPRVAGSPGFQSRSRPASRHRPMRSVACIARPSRSAITPSPRSPHPRRSAWPSGSVRASSHCRRVSMPSRMPCRRASPGLPRPMTPSPTRSDTWSPSGYSAVPSSPDTSTRCVGWSMEVRRSSPRMTSRRQVASSPVGRSRSCRSARCHARVDGSRTWP